MKPGKITPQNMHIIAAKREPPFRPEKTTEELRIIELEHKCSVLTNSVTQLLGAKVFYGDHHARVEVRREVARLKAAGITIQGVAA